MNNICNEYFSILIINICKAATPNITYVSKLLNGRSIASIFITEAFHLIPSYQQSPKFLLRHSLLVPANKNMTLFQ